MKVGLLTGGGDCPGLNAVIRSVVRRIANAGGECVGVLEGWRGLVRGNTRPLRVAETDSLIGQGGTILGSSRTNPYKNPETDVPLLRRNFAALELDALVVIGGDDTLGVAVRLINDFELPIVGIPKTIDNDLKLVDFSFGFDTAVNIVVESVERLRTTAESHRRVIVVETMGRSTGWIACFAGMAVGADYILVPEVPIDAPTSSRFSNTTALRSRTTPSSWSPKAPDTPTPACSTSNIDRSATPASAASAPPSPRSSNDRPESKPAPWSSATSNAAAPHSPRPNPRHPLRPRRRRTRPPRPVRHRRHPERRADRRSHPQHRRPRQPSLDLSYYQDAATFFYNAMSKKRSNNGDLTP